MSISEFDLALVHCEFNDVVTERMAAMVAPKYSFFHFKLVIVEELLKKARFRIFVELRAHQASRAVSRAHFARGINLYLLLGSLLVVHPLVCVQLVAALSTLGGGLIACTAVSK